MALLECSRYRFDTPVRISHFGNSSSFAADRFYAATAVDCAAVSASVCLVCKQPEDRFKVWPTNRDRPAFNAVMAAQLPVDYDAVGFVDERMVQAHRYFGDKAIEWLNANGPEQVASRANAIETVVRDLLQVVVIDLGAEENAQEIFETLNARGAQLTAADLIKNFIFQRLLESGANAAGLQIRIYHRESPPPPSAGLERPVKCRIPGRGLHVDAASAKTQTQNWCFVARWPNRHRRHDLLEPIRSGEVCRWRRHEWLVVLPGCGEAQAFVT